MKLLFITQNEAPFRMRWMDELAKYAEVTVFHANEYAKEVNAKYISYRTSRAITKDISRKYFGKKVYSIGEIKKETYDLLILDGYGFLAQQILLMYLKIRNIPYIMSIDGGIMKEREGHIKHGIKSCFISGAYAYLSTSEYTDRYIQNYVGNKALIYRHLFSSVSKKDILSRPVWMEKAEIRHELKLEDKFTAIAVGQFIPRKGFDVLIEALKYIETDVQIVFVGGDGKGLYEDQIDDRIREKIRFIKFCDSSLLGKYYMAADVFVLPTRYDIWGLVVGEAMSYGLPVITTAMCMAGVSMIRNGVNGYIVKAEDAMALAEKIDYLQRHGDICRSMGEKNIEVIRQYSIEEASKQDMEHFEKIYEGMK